MNTETEYLKSIAEEITAIQPSPNTDKPNHHLATEAKRLEKDITIQLTSIGNFTQRDTFHFNTLSKLVNICDILYDIHQIVTPDVKTIIELLTAVKQVIPDEIWPNLKLPKAFISIQQEPISENWKAVEELMRNYAIDEKLIKVAAIPFKRFMEPTEILFWQDFTWLRGYQAKLKIMDWENADCNSKTEALISLLIGRDFNDDRFYIYCKKYIQHRTHKIIGKRNRLLEYSMCEKLVLEDTQVGVAPFDLRANTVSARLIKWIREEIDFVETHEREQHFAKLRFNLYVNRVAFFFKLLSEQKVFGETSFRELAEQIASTCLSIDGEDIHARTIISKAYPKDQKMLSEMESMLVKMLEYVRSFMRKK